MAGHADEDTALAEERAPGSFLRERERLAEAVQRTLLDKCDISGLTPRQLLVPDDPGRDDRGWMLSVAHLDVVPVADAQSLFSRPDLRWAPIVEGRVVVPGQRRLPFDHDATVTHAVERFRADHVDVPDPYRLLEEPFTVRELRHLHEAVLGEDLQKDTFRRAMLPHLVATRSTDSGSVGRPARRYRRA
ncbi:MAG: NrtR DNA-binding winged helix domain-containing protein [Acidimicrobiia bacterium]